MVDALVERLRAITPRSTDTDDGLVAGITPEAPMSGDEERAVERTGFGDHSDVELENVHHTDRHDGRRLGEADAWTARVSTIRRSFPVS